MGKDNETILRSTEFCGKKVTLLMRQQMKHRNTTIQMLNVYADFCEEILAIPMIKGQKTEKEKFAGANSTYTIEALMHDGKALQSGTTHNFGDGFAKALIFNIQTRITNFNMCTKLLGEFLQE